METAWKTAKQPEMKSTVYETHAESLMEGAM